jgi:hypothetical protein
MYVPSKLIVHERCGDSQHTGLRTADPSRRVRSLRSFALARDDEGEGFGAAEAGAPQSPALSEFGKRRGCRLVVTFLKRKQIEYNRAHFREGDYPTCARHEL